MNMMLQPKERDAKLGQIIKIAVLAVGGQGGGVLTNWIERVARSQNYACQTTSVAGVSQRTGSTIYYVELAPGSDDQPVFSLAPSEGDVDIVIGSEMMEVGRAVMRGFVTPDRTTLIGSTHRALAVSEKMVPGNGMADADEVRSAAEITAQRLILADMDSLATRHGSVISSSLFGALAGSGALPFARTAFEDAIKASGKGVEASLRAFKAGFEAAQNPTEPEPTSAQRSRKIVGPDKLMRQWQSLQDRVFRMPDDVHEMTSAGLAKIVDFQDLSYGTLYLDRLDTVLAQDTEAQNWLLTKTAAKYVANAMAYDDIIRVADLKTRAPRSKRIKREMKASDENLVEVTEFFHPRAEEITSLFPAKMGARWETSERRMKLLKRLFNKGRRLRTDTLPVFLMLNFLGGLKRYRLKTRRHQVEVEHLEKWLMECVSVASKDYDLGVELLINRRLIKGYSDTHARGLRKFDRVMNCTELLEGRDDAKDWMQRLREAALQDEDGSALDGVIRTIRNFV